MSIDVISLACPVCGAPFSPNDENCGYCGSILVLRTDHPKINPATLNKQVIDTHIAEFRNDLRKDPNDSAAHYGLGVAYFNLRLTDDSVRELEEAARLMPENPNIQSQLAVVLKQAVDEGRPNSEPKLRDRIEYTLRLDPDNFDALALKAESDNRLSNKAVLEILENLYSMDPARGLPNLIAAYISNASHEDVRGTKKEIELLRKAFELDNNKARKPLADAMRRRAISLSESDPYADTVDPTRSSKAIDAWLELSAFLPEYATDELTRYLTSMPGLSGSGQRSLRRITAEADSKETKSFQRQLVVDKVADTAERTTNNIVRPVIVGILKGLGLIIACFIAFGVIGSLLPESQAVSVIFAIAVLLSVPMGLVYMPVMEVKKARRSGEQSRPKAQHTSDHTPAQATSPHRVHFAQLLTVLRSHFLLRWDNEAQTRIKLDRKNGGSKAEKIRDKQMKTSLSKAKP